MVEGCIGLFRINCLPTATGTFNNPTLYAMAVSLSVPALLYFLNNSNKIVKCWVCICFITLLVAIVLSKSRTGILCMGIAGLFLLNKICKINHRNFVGICVILTLCMFLFMLCYKEDSTMGRSFILSRSLEMVKDKPFGWGKDGFAKHYMDYQANFFKQNNDERYAYLADDIRHPLNEFVLVAVNWGIIGLLLALLFTFVVIVWIQKTHIKEKETILLFILILCTWALFAYPSTLSFVGLFVSVYFLPLLHNTLGFSRHVKGFLVLGMISIVYTMVDCKYRHAWEKGVTLCKKGQCEESLQIMGQIEEYYSHNADFLYSYATVLYNCSFYEKTIEVLQQYKEYATSYGAELMIANSYMYMESYKQAQESYTEAHYMCPVRFTPLYNLFKICKWNGEIENMKRIGNQILSKKIKVYSPEIEIIKHNTKVELQRLSQHEN